jgi:hypothetical protein
MSIFTDSYPRLVYRAKDGHPGFEWKTVKDPGEAEALGPDWHDTPAEAIEERAKKALAEKGGAALEHAGAALQTKGEALTQGAPADQEPAAEHADAPAVAKGRRRP